MYNQKNLPTIAERSRILSVTQVATLLGLSVPHLRTLYRTGKMPRGIKIGDRKLGWPVGVVADFLMSKMEQA